ncbi:MAG: hypothetical protein IT453_16795 [Planctomycetes bacterium]|nr:hypothetical protein [Planctomycetota bacterium]
MSAHPNDRAVFEPEVEALLAEAASNPNSLLLRVPRSGTVPHRAWVDAPVRVSKTGLTSVERHLLAAHRSEIAQGLRRMCRERLEADRTPGRRVFAVRLGREHSEPVGSIGELARGMAEALRSSGAAGPELAREPWSPHTATAEELATLAMRLEPSSATQIWWGLAAVVRGDVAAGRRAFERVIEETRSVSHLSMAWSDLGLVRVLEDDPIRAQVAYRHAWRLRPDNALAGLVACFYAVQTGNAALLESYSTDLESAVRAQAEDCAVAYAADLRQLRSAGRWAPSKESLELAARFGERMGPAGRSVLSVFK